METPNTITFNKVFHDSVLNMISIQIESSLLNSLQHELFFNLNIPNDNYIEEVLYEDLKQANESRITFGDIDELDSDMRIKLRQGLIKFRTNNPLAEKCIITYYYI